MKKLELDLDNAELYGRSPASRGGVKGVTVKSTKEGNARLVIGGDAVKKLELTGNELLVLAKLQDGRFALAEHENGVKARKSSTNGVTRTLNLTSLKVVGTPKAELTDDGCFFPAGSFAPNGE